jgi:hypothetical protein
MNMAKSLCFLGSGIDLAVGAGQGLGIVGVVWGLGLFSRSVFLGVNCGSSWALSALNDVEICTGRHCDVWKIICVFEDNTFLRMDKNSIYIIPPRSRFLVGGDAHMGRKESGGEIGRTT